MIDIITAGILQGILEWLPISSEGVISFVLRNYFNKTFNEGINLSLFLHFGTVFSIIYYFRKDLKKIWITQSGADFRFISFLFLATFLSFLTAGPAYILLRIFNMHFPGGLIIGCLLIITGIIHMFGKQIGEKKYKDIRIKHAWIPGMLQGISILPGISRSGITLFALLYQGFSVKESFKISFIMSIPVILIGNIILGIMQNYFFRPEYLLGVLVSFFVGIISIDYVLKISRKINFGTACIILGLLSFLLG